MSDAITLMPQAFTALSERVHAVPSERWDHDTPCTEWTVRDLLNHLTAEHLWAADLLDGRTIEEVGDRYDGDVLGGDPASAWDRAAEASRTRWGTTPPDREVDLSWGPTPALEYAEQMLGDLVVHGWDLARGAGLDERMPLEAVEHVLAYARDRIGGWSGSGMFAAPVDVDSDDPQDQLVALFGRRP